MFNPIATYRIQLHKDFRLEDLSHAVPYLHTLGASTVYASPVFASVSGSTHGYDGTSPLQINPEIGTLDELIRLNQKLRSLGMNWLQDIVPNHMAFHTCNDWLMDVLEKGPKSAYARFFDTSYTSGLFRQKLMVPFLGVTPETAVQNGELAIGYEQQRLVLRYYNQFFPLKPESYITLLCGIDSPLQQLSEQLPPDTEDNKAYSRAWGHFCEALAGLTTDESVRRYMTGQLERVNGDPEALLKIVADQHYRLCHWQETDSRISYRRFFTINGLICLNIQDETVFNRYHDLIKELTQSGIFSGLRVDHIDGLYDPQIYLERLHALAGPEAYIVVEKILQPDEGLPDAWPVQGNTGYDFLAIVNNLFTYRPDEDIFTDYYRRISGIKDAPGQLLVEKKRRVLLDHMRGELDNLSHLFTAIMAEQLSGSGISEDDIKETIAGLLVHCPVYRYYGNSFPLAKKEAEAIVNMLAAVEKEQPRLTVAVRFFKTIFTNANDTTPDLSKRLSDWYCRLMQFTGPLMAKGMEDTLMYTYNRFIGHNEVGDSPALFGITTTAFHQWMEDRRQHWPLSLNATATHDTKRGEDVRARLNVISEMGAAWTAKVTEWMQMNGEHKPDVLPDANDEYFLYQTIAGAYPMPGSDVDKFVERLQAYIPKALREAKTHSQWHAPDEKYETAAQQFVAAIMQPGSRFRENLEQWLEPVTDFGIINSLAQLLLKCTCPGTPDIYQGTELWDLSLVDPDNRRPVDYALRNRLAETMPGDFNTLWEERYNGRIKMWLTQKLLAERKEYTDVFGKGSYIPLDVKGRHKDHVLAFARRYEHTWFITAIPLHYAKLCRKTNSNILQADWQDTRIVLPDHAPGGWQHLLWDAKGDAGTEIKLSELFKKFPLALIRLQAATSRSAGLLLHITSLPSAFGIGDMGPVARKFADFLCNSCQKFWQLLPLNPVVAESDYSPYSSVSAMAGNELLISPGLLATEGLLDTAILEAYKLPASSTIDFPAAIANKKQLLETAHQNFKQGHFPLLQQQFHIFCRQEQHWLDDFALFVILKSKHDGKPWTAWPEPYRKRDAKALQDFAAAHAAETERVKWIQYQFIHQWKQLKAYCNGRGIKLFGDLPFYVSHDSADVWSHPEIFCLDKQGNINGIAGVPPDYFSEDGQLWGMPTYNWKVLQQRHYDWWLQRLKRNMELYDVLRLDHFRAFAQYWEVPAGETTARNGRWLDGPGIAFFDFIRNELGQLPFVAEDLGDHMEAVYKLRDAAKLPGMKVLQFAFGTHMPQSVDIPHNYSPDCIVYTGTHDNNTTTGWYQDEAGRADHKRLEKYAGMRVNAGNIHLVLARMAYASVAKTAIIPMQDALGLGNETRMNVPGTSGGNWRWRLMPDELTAKLQKRLCNWARMYNRL